MLQGYVRRLVGNDERAEELLQEVSVRMLAAEGPDDPERYAAWARGVVRHVIAHHSRMRRRAQAEQPFEEEDLMEEFVEPAADPEARLDARAWVERIVGDLDREGLQLLYRRYVLQESGKELADDLASSPAAMRMRLMRLRAGARPRPAPADAPRCEFFVDALTERPETAVASPLIGVRAYPLRSFKLLLFCTLVARPSRGVQRRWPARRQRRRQRREPASRALAGSGPGWQHVQPVRRGRAPADGRRAVHGGHAPAIADFDDYTAGTAASSYTYYVNGEAARSGRGARRDSAHRRRVGHERRDQRHRHRDGGGRGQRRLRDADRRTATRSNWGGLLLFYFPSNGACLNAQSYRGVEFSIKGSSPSGRIGVSLGMLDTIAGHGQRGLRQRDGERLQERQRRTETGVGRRDLGARADPVERVHARRRQWARVRAGHRAEHLQLAIQPFMNYPPPNYTLAPGPYTIAVDNVRFY